MQWPTLIVVDMQPEFSAAFDPEVVVGVTCEILRARDQSRPVILLEYRGCGRSHRGFYNLLRNYQHKAIIGKDDNDGSREIVQTLKRRRFNVEYLRICGVNSDACVLVTVKGLLQKLDRTRIEVVKQACGTETDFDWRKFIRHPNLRLV